MLPGISGTITENILDEVVGTLIYCYLFSCHYDGIWLPNSMSHKLLNYFSNLSGSAPSYKNKDCC